MGLSALMRREYVTPCLCLLSEGDRSWHPPFTNVLSPVLCGKEGCPELCLQMPTQGAIFYLSDANMAEQEPACDKWRGHKEPSTSPAMLSEHIFLFSLCEGREEERGGLGQGERRERKVEVRGQLLGVTSLYRIETVSTCLWLFL